MATAVALDALDLAALLCSRVCHDLIGPTAAIVNGLEMLEEEETDDATRTFALDLIRKSARSASARLQFCRLAFGAAGAAGARIDLGDAQAMARAFVEDGRTRLDWNLPPALLPKNRVKLLLNLLVIAGQTIPRGGALTVEIVFSYPGVGNLTLTALDAQDYQLLQGMFLFFSLAVVLANLAADLLYGRLDPRVQEA